MRRAVRERAAYDAAITAELQEIAPRAVPLFTLANHERARGRHEAALEHYRQVVTLAPRFDPAVRRAGGELLELGRRTEGLALLRSALAMRRSVENLTANARALVQTQHPTDAEKREALALVAEPAARDTRDVNSLFEIAIVAIATGEQPLLERTSSRMIDADPGQWEAHYFRAFAFGMEGQLAQANTELGIARTAGMPETVYRDAVKHFDAARPPWQRLALLGAYVAVPWLVCLAALLLAALVLDRNVGRAPALGPLRDGVLVVARAYRFLSIAVVIALTLGFFGATLSLARPGQPAGSPLLTTLILLGAVTTGVMLRGLFVKEEGATRWLNPLWLVLAAYDCVFASITRHTSAHGSSDGSQKEKGDL